MTRQLMKKADAAMAATYMRFPLTIVKGEGCHLYDSEGNRYIDFLAGIAVCNLGHAHPEVAAALTEQANRLWHVSNLYYTEPQTALAEWLVKRSFADRVFFCNSGAEANEAAIKLARKYFYDKGQSERYRIIAMEMSFHGRTLATLTATGQDKIKKGFAPLPDGFDHVPFNDLTALRAKIGPATAAVLMEPILGEGGVLLPEPGYIKKVREICDKHGLLLIFDEIQTGIGRTGRLFAYENFDVVPDIMTLAKALANGLPMGAMLATEKVVAAFDAGSHATTFGGTPIVSAAALKVMQVIEEKGIVARGCETGAYFKQKLVGLQKKHASIVDVRGMGLLLGAELNREGASVVAACQQKGFLINCIQEKILRFAPPLVIEKEAIDALVDCLDEIL
jgi:acetylornithine/N-succinyldiaminopimelate aminotransferase